MFFPTLNNLITRYVASSGIVEGVAPGSVAQWLDLGGDGLHLSQSVAGSQPMLIADGGLEIRNQPVISFDGIDDLLENTDFNSLEGQNKANFYLLLKIDNLTGTKQIFWNDNFAFEIVISASYLKIQIGTGYNQYPVSSFLQEQMYYLFRVEYDGTQVDNQTRVKLYVNNLFQLPLIITGQFPVQLTYGSETGLSLAASSTATYNYFNKIDVAEFFLTGELNQTETEQLQDYFYTNYNLGQPSSFQTLEGLSFEEAEVQRFFGVNLEESGVQRFLGINLEEAETQRFLGVNFEEEPQRPVFFGITFEEPFENLRVIIRNTDGSFMEGVSISISSAEHTDSGTTGIQGFVDLRYFGKIENTLVLEKNGYQRYVHKFIREGWDYVWEFTLYKVVPLISTGKSYHVSLDPENPTNNHML